MITTALATANPGQTVGAAMNAMASGDYGWAQIEGPCELVVNAAAAAGLPVNTTVTAGILNTDATTGTRIIGDIWLSAAGSTISGPSPTLGAYMQARSYVGKAN